MGQGVLTSQLWPLLSPHLPATITETHGAGGWVGNSLLTLMLRWTLGSLGLCPGRYTSRPKSVKKKKWPPVASEETTATVHAQSQAGELDVLHNSFSKSQLAVVVYACNANTQKAKAREFVYSENLSLW